MMHFLPRGAFVGIWSLFLLMLLISVEIEPALSQDSKENAEFKLAVNLYNDGMYDLALEQFRTFIASYSATAQGIEARFYLGLTQLKLRSYDDARITFQDFALSHGGHPRAAEAWVNVGEAYAGLGNLHEAASAFERVRIFHPKSPLSPDALLRAGMLYRKLGETDPARRALRTLIQDYPSARSALPARLEISEIMAAEGQLEAALREAQTVSESSAPIPLRAQALVAVGRMNQKASLFNDATVAYRAVIATFPSTPAASIARYQLGMIESGAGNPAAAMELFTASAADTAAEDSLRERAFLASGRTALEQRQYPNARKSFENLLQSFPESPFRDDARVGAVEALLGAGNTGDALKHLRDLITSSLPPVQRRAFVLAADASLQANRPADAVMYLQRYSNQFPDDPFSPEILLRMGMIENDRLGSPRKAIGIFDHLLQRYMQSRVAPQALEEMASCQEILGSYNEALGNLGEILNRFPAYDHAARIRQKAAALRNHSLKNRESAVDTLARLLGDLAAADNRTDLAYRLGLLYIRDLKDYSAAIRQLTYAIDNGLSEDAFRSAYFHRARAVHLEAEKDGGDASRAILYYDAYVKQFPSGPMSEDAAYYSFVLKTSHNGPHEFATAARAYITIYPDSRHLDSVLTALGEALLRTGDARGAADTFGRVIREFPASQFSNDALFLRGLAYLDLGKPDSAEIFWSTAVNTSATGRYTAAALWKLGCLRHDRKVSAEAIAPLLRITGEYAYTSYADSAERLLPRVYVDGRQPDEAATIYRDLLNRLRVSPFQSTTADPELLLGLASAYEESGRKQEARRYYHDLLAIDHRSATAGKAFFALGNIARLEGKESLGSSYFKQAAAIGSSDTPTPAVADLLFQTEQYAGAASQYRRLAEETSDPATKKLYESRAIIALLRIDRTTEAQPLIAAFEKTHGKDKLAQAEFLFEQGHSAFRKEDYPGARKLFEKVVDDYEDTRFGPWGHYYIGKILEAIDKPDDAAKRYELIIRNFPNSDVLPRVFLSVGNMHFNVERYEDAIRHYQRITVNPDAAGDILPFAMNNLIEAYESTKLYDEALKVTRDYIRRYPNDDGIIDKKIKIGTLYTKIGYFDQAILHFKDLLDEAGSLLEAEIRYYIGEACYYKGDYQQAILEFLKVPYLVARQGKVDWTATSFYMAGQAYEKMSKVDEAIGMYQQIIDRPGIDATFKAAARKEIDRVKSLNKREGG